VLYIAVVNKFDATKPLAVFLRPCHPLWESQGKRKAIWSRGRDKMVM
jgi:hypothetical protein